MFSVTCAASFVSNWQITALCVNQPGRMPLFFILSIVLVLPLAQLDIMETPLIARAILAISLVLAVKHCLLTVMNVTQLQGTDGTTMPVIILVPLALSLQTRQPTALPVPLTASPVRTHRLLAHRAH